MDPVLMKSIGVESVSYTHLDVYKRQTLSLTGDYITQPIKTAVRKSSLNLVNKDSAIITSKLKDKAGIVGACMLARSRMFES